MYLNNIFLGLALFASSMAMAQDTKAAKKTVDTLMMKFGEQSHLLFLIDGEKDLYRIQQYNLNAMVDDISIGVDTTNGDSFISISDPSGEKYLKTNYKEISSKEHSSSSIWDKDITEHRKNNDDEKSKSKNFRLRDKGIRSFTNIELGFNNYLQNDALPEGEDYRLKPFGSYTLGVNFIGKTNVLGPLFLEWGPGLSYHQFRMEEPSFRIRKDADQVAFEQIQGVEALKSQFNATYINFSLMPSIDLGWFGGKKKRRFYGDWRGYSSRSVRMGLGGYAGYRVGSRSRFEYKEGGNKNKDIERSDYYLNSWRYGIKAQVGWRGIDLFATYDLNPLFASNRGPGNNAELNTITFGIIF